MNMTSHDHDVTVRRTAGSDRTVTESWRENIGPSQIVAFVFGIFFVVTGIIGIARAGMDDLTGESVSVAGMEMTGLLALIHVAIGAIALFGVPSIPAAKSSLAMLGTLLVIGGLLALIQPMDSMGWDETNGVLYLIGAVVGLATAMYAYRNTQVEHREVVEERVE